MNGIIGMTELALGTSLTQEQNEYLNLVKSSAESLHVLLNDILDFSKIEAGKLELEPIPFEMRDCLEETIHTLAYKADEKGLELALRIQPEFPDQLIGDPGRLRQVIINLVDNALKFTSEGEIVVNLESAEQRDADLLAHFSVKDTGIGIPKNKQDKIFSAFTQADGSTTRNYGGTGLGLAIVSRLVTMFGGSVWIDSEPGRGSEFHFTARFGIQMEPTAATEPLAFEKLRDLRALVVDDNHTARRIVQEVLTGWGMKVRTAEDGASAIDWVGRAEGGEGQKPIDLVVMDSQMPRMGGFELAHRLRRYSALDRTPFVMLTSSAARGDAARCREVGISGYLPKPVRQSELLAVIMTALGDNSSRNSISESRLVTRYSVRTIGFGSRLHILVAEDNHVNQKLAQKLLEKNGHNVEVVSNGVQAVEAVENRYFDLILMDIQMPELDGMKAAEIIRSKERARGLRIPIIAMTAYAMKGDRERFLESGFDGYVAKPIDPGQLFGTIEELMDRVPKRPIIAKFSNTTPGDSGAIDFKALLNRVGGDRDLLREMMEIFLEEMPLRFAEIDAAIRAADQKALEQAAHSLKGSIGYFSGTEAFDAARAMVENARQGLMDDMPGLFERLARAGAVLEDEIKARLENLS